MSRLSPAEPPTTDSSFSVRLDNFEGPFDLLLQLISKHKMDVTEVSLSKVTDEFIAHIKAAGGVWDLEQTSQFIVIAATLLDLKAARLLPSGEVEDPEDMALLEARDLLFSRLLQYRAFKQVAAFLAATLAEQGKHFPRPGGIEDAYARLLPEVRITVGLDGFAALAAKAMLPKPQEQLSLEHLHTATVSVQDQAQFVIDRLKRAGSLSFHSLCRGADRLTVVARFLALLELYREHAVAFEQLNPLGELTIRLSGPIDEEVVISHEFDEDISDV